MFLNMDLQKLLLQLNEVKSLFEKCDKCTKICDIQHKINLCGHLYCAKCILSIDACIKCGITCTPKDICVNKREEDHLIKQFNDLETLLKSQTFNNEKKSLSLIPSIQDETESINEEDFNNIIDNYSTCDCTSYVQLKAAKQKCIDKKELVNKRNAVGETKLFHACKKGNEKEVNELLDTGAWVNIQDYAGWTPLHEAVYSRNLNIVESLLKLGSVVNAPGDMYDTPLHKAVETNNLEMSSLLIKYGADINSRNYDGNTPMDMASAELKKSLTNMKPETKILKMPDSKHNFVFYILGEKDKKIVEVINLFNNKLMPITNTNTLNEHVTHVISTSLSKLLEPSYELLLAIAHQIPVISQEWLKECITLHKLSDYKENFIIGTNDIVSDVIYKSQVNKYKMNPKLFSGCNFYIMNSYSKTNYKINDKTITKDELMKLIIAAGGKILKREPHLATISENLNKYPWHAKPGSTIEECCHYIVYTPAPPNESRQEMKYNMKELKHVPYTWLFECILQYKLINPTFE